MELEKESRRPEKVSDPSPFRETVVPDVSADDGACTKTLQPADASPQSEAAADVTLTSQNTKTTPICELLRQPPGSPDDMGNYFYLVKPRTTGNEKVLVVLSPTDSLLDCLKNQTVLEFPSIQVLPNPPHSLPNGFVLVNDWLDKFKKEQDEMERLLAEAGDLEAGEVQGNSIEETLPPGLQKMSNADDVLAILEQDVLERKGL